MFNSTSQENLLFPSKNKDFLSTLTTITSLLTASIQIQNLTHRILEILIKSTTPVSSEAKVISPLDVIDKTSSANLDSVFIPDNNSTIKSNFFNFFSKNTSQDKLLNYKNSIQINLYKLSIARPMLDKNIIIQQIKLLIYNQENSQNTQIFFALDDEQLKKFKLNLYDYMEELSKSSQSEIYEYHLNQFYSFYLNEFAKRNYFSSSSEIKNNVYNL